LDVRVRGAIGVVELEKINHLAALKKALLEQDVWVRPFRNIIYLTPALTITEPDLQKLIGAITNVLR
jgi:adenosylmethionine---8-amino-7-oxononanoate aminotransferase